MTERTIKKIFDGLAIIMILFGSAAVWIGNDMVTRQPVLAMIAFVATLFLFNAVVEPYFKKNELPSAFEAITISFFSVVAALRLFTLSDDFPTYALPYIFVGSLLLTLGIQKYTTVKENRFVISTELSTIFALERVRNYLSRKEWVEDHADPTYFQDPRDPVDQVFRWESQEIVISNGHRSGHFEAVWLYFENDDRSESPPVGVPLLKCRAVATRAPEGGTSLIITTAAPVYASEHFSHQMIRLLKRELPNEFKPVVKSKAVS